MIRINTKGFIWASVIIIIASYLIISKLFHSSLFGDISKTVSIFVFVFFVYSKWLWKKSPFIKFLPFPYLGGIWQGELKSTYEDDMTIKLRVEIKHSLFHPYLKMYTDESHSISNSFSFNIDEDKGIRQIIYTYQNNPKATERHHSSIHYGAAVLNFNEKGNFMEGNYWTDRKTTGTIELTKINKHGARYT